MIAFIRQSNPKPEPTQTMNPRKLTWGTAVASLLLATAPARADITYIDAQEGASGNTYATGGTADDTSWIDTTSNSFSASSDWMKRFGGDPGWTEHNGGDAIQGLVTEFPNELGEITTEISGLDDGRYDVWVFFWEQSVSDIQDWVIDAGLTSGSLSTFSSSLGPVAGTDSDTPVNAGTLAFANSPSVTAAGGNQTMFGVNLGQVAVSDGSSIQVYVDKLFGFGSTNRTVFDGVGYERTGPLSPPELIATDPADDATDTPTTGNFVATFNDLVQAGAGGNVTLRRSGDDSTVEILSVTDTTPPGTVTFSGNTVTIDPTEDLEGGIEYYIEIDPDAIVSSVDLGFPGISGPGEWNFTTDGTAPSGTDMAPMNGAVGIQPDAGLSLSFDEDVVGVAGKFITVHLADGTVVEAIDASAANISGGEVGIPISAELTLGASYYVTVDEGAFTDLSGNPFAGISGSSAWTFATVASNITYVDAVDGAAGNTFATGSALSDTSWVGPDAVSANETQWNKREIAGSNDGSLYQGWTNSTPPPELTTRIDGLADGTYLIWAFYWDQVQSNTQNWVLSAGLTSGDLTTYSSPGEPAVAGATTAGVTNAANLIFTNPVSVEAGLNGSTFLRNLFGVELGTVEVSGGNPVEVYLGNNLANGSSNRSWYDGVGYQLVTPAPGPRITSFTAAGAGAWELTLLGAPETVYEFRSSGTLEFDPGALVTGLTQFDSEDPGTIGGGDDSLLTTDADGIGTVRMTLAGPRNFVRAQPPLPLFSEDFEDDDGGFTVATSDGTPWAWGDPDSTGIGGSVATGNGGSVNCWGTGIGDPGFYADPTATCLRSPAIDLTAVAAAELTFAAALDLEPNDSVTINIIDGATDTVIVGDIVSITDGNTASAAWENADPIAIPAAALGQTVRLEWCLNGEGGPTDDYLGWYIDDVVIEETSP
jgi:hypothetical protein